MTSHLLIVEDDEFVQQLMAAYFQNEGFRVSLAASGEEMFAILDIEPIELILLDLGLPDEDGLTLARQIRTVSTVPIVILTAREHRDNRLAALDLGADDYLTKPCDPHELVLRVRNLISRSKGGDSAPQSGEIAQKVHFEGWVMNFDERLVLAPDGREVHLTRSEYNLLAALVRAPNRILTRDHLLDALNLKGEPPSDRTIDVLVSRLRRKIEREPKKPELIVTVTGFGYKLSAKVSSRARSLAEEPFNKPFQR